MQVHWNSYPRFPVLGSNNCSDIKMPREKVWKNLRQGHFINRYPEAFFKKLLNSSRSYQDAVLVDKVVMN